MTSFRVRPRFKQETSLNEQEIRLQLEEAITKSNGLCSISSNIPGYVTLRIRPEDRHFWSPQLNLTFEEKEEDPSTTLIRGLYGPNPQVWTLIFFSYATLGVATFFLLMIGLSQLSLGKEAGILWGVPIVLVLGLVLYMVSQFGQKIGADQTYRLHHIFEEALHTEVKIQ